jgi:hypothetical protein
MVSAFRAAPISATTTTTLAASWLLCRLGGAQPCGSTVHTTAPPDTGCGSSVVGFRMAPSTGLRH